ncbi:MAG: (d)CMP kinase [Clostridia bacterium]|nr:(d)CMP kinase [Clostridia bacterium]
MINIAIDGPSGAGKSTLAGFVAKELSLVHVDTGALYRAVGFYIVKNKVEPSNAEKVVKLLESLNVDVEYDSNRKQHVFVNGEEVNEQLRTNDVSMAASAVSAIPEVRSFLLDLQRNIAEKENIIMDGRDVGTVILPNANIKFFLFASPEKRADRRFKEYAAKGIDISYDKVLEDIIQRDFNDSNRKISPLKQAEDAIPVDNSEMTEDETKKFILNIIKEKLS